MERFAMMTMMVMVVMAGVVTAAPHLHYPDLQISISLTAHDEGPETQQRQISELVGGRDEAQEYTVKIQSAAGITDEEEAEEEGNPKVAHGPASVSEVKVNKIPHAKEGTVKLNKDPHNTRPAGVSVGQPGRLTKDKPHSSKDVTTTTLDPLTEFCKEACAAGVGGPECDCPDHPIG